MTVTLTEPDRLDNLGPFTPVHQALRDVMTSEPPLILEQVMNGAVGLVLTFAINVHISLLDAAKQKGTPIEDVPSIENIAATISFHAVRAAREAGDKAAEQFGIGATKQ